MIPIAILSAGACLHAQWREEYRHQFACIIAVNGAAEHYAHHWLACGDGPRLATLRATPSVGIFTMRQNLENLKLGAYPHLPNDVTMISWQSVTPLPEHLSPHYCSYTLPMSLLLAQTLGATVVYIYGHSGGEGPAIDAGKHNETPERWRKEAACLAAIQEYTGIPIVITRDDCTNSPYFLGEN